MAAYGPTVFFSGGVRCAARVYDASDALLQRCVVMAGVRSRLHLLVEHLRWAVALTRSRR